jgi:predicted outer membrane repeat protein
MRSTPLIVVSLVCCVVAAMYAGSDSVKSKAAMTVQAAGRGKPYFNFQDGRELQVDYRGDRNLTEALRGSQAQPRSVASIVLAGDAVPDLIAGYSWNGMGVVTVQHGNPDAFVPKDESVFVRMQQGYNPDSLLPTADAYPVPEAVDFLQVGDFNHDNRKDVLAAARGGDLFLLAGDGRGRLEAAEQISLPGKVTAMTAGEFRAADGWTDVAVAVDGPSGPALLIYDGVEGLQGAPMSFPLNAPASAIQIAGLDNDSFVDMAVAAGNEIDIIHGWGRKQSVDPQSRLQRINLNSSARDMAVGFFIWNRAVSNQIAVLSDDGTVRILEPAGSDARPFSAEEIALFWHVRANAKREIIDVESLKGWQPSETVTWTTARQFATNSSLAAEAVSQSVLQRSHISFQETDDLLLLDGSQHKLNIVRQRDAQAGVQTEALASTNDLTTVSLDAADATEAVLALPQKLNGERSLVMMQRQTASPILVPLAPTATPAVDRFDDPVVTTAGSGAAACTGASNDCSLRGAVLIANANPGSTITLLAGTYTLSINGTSADGCDGNTVGDLGINENTTITGAGSATTIIRQTGTGPVSPANTGDRVMCLDETIAANKIYNFSGITITGGRNSTTFGGAGIIGGGPQTVSTNIGLTLTDVVVSNNQATGTGDVNGGGGIQWAGGNVTISNSVIGGVNPPCTPTGGPPAKCTVAQRADASLANAEASGGGGLSFDPSTITNGQVSNLVVTGTTFNHNTASAGTSGGGGVDLLVLSFGGHTAGTGTATFNTCTFTNNQALVSASGGGMAVEAFPAIVGNAAGTTQFTSNSSANRGGGIYVTGTLTLDGTTATITFSGNSATTAGSSISTAGAVTAKGTNVTIGGDLEVTTNGSWTNTNGVGTSISPTNVVIAGGTWTSNDSTTNVSGNFSFNTGTFNANTGTFNFNGSGTQSISNNSSITFNTLTDSNTTQPLTANNSFVVGGTLNVNGANAIFDPVAAAVISGAGTLTGTGTARVRRIVATPDFLSQYTMTTKTLTNLTVEYIGVGAAQTCSALTYNNLKINNASGVNLAAVTTTVNGTLTLTAGALGVGTSTLVINDGTSVGAGSLTSGATGTVNYNQSSSGQSVIAGTYGNLTFSAFTKVLASSGTIGIAGTFNTGGIAIGHTINGSTVDFNGTGAQTVPAFNFNNLTISQARTINLSVTLVSGGTIGVFGTFSPTATFSGTGGFIVTNNTMDFNGTGAQTVPAFNYNNLTISGSRAVVITLGGGNVGVASTFNPSVTGNTWVNAGNTVVFNGTATQTIPAFAFFNGLNLSNSTGANLGGGVTVGGALTLTTGALGVGTNTLTLNGAVSAPGGSLTSGAAGTVNYNQGSNGQATVLAANYGNLTFSSFSKTLAGSGTIGVAGTFTPGSGVGHTITGSTINFNGTGSQNIPGFTYNNLTSSGGGVARILDSVNTIKIAGTFTPGTDTYTITGSTIEYNGSAAQILPSTGFNTYNNLTLNNITTTTGFAGLTVNGLIEVKAGTFTSSSTYNNVQIDSGATLAGTTATTINVSGNWTNNGGTFTANGNTVNFNGSSTQTIGGTGTTTFNNLTVSNTTAISMTNDNTVNGVLALTNADINVASTKTLSQASGIASTGTFDVVGNVKRLGTPLLSAVGYTFGNPNNVITFTAAGTRPNDVTVNLSKSVPGPANGAPGFPNAVARTYTISQTAGVGFSATLRLHYLVSELNGNIEGPTLNLWQFNGTGWAPRSQTANSTSSPNNWVEKSGVLSFSPWTFNSTLSPTASNGSVSGRITTADGSPVAGAVINLSGTQARKTITDSNGNYEFANVDTSGFYTVTPARANYNFSPTTRSFSQIGSKTEAAFTATSTGDSVNPLDTAEYFVRQQYVDVLGREPDESGFNYWSDQILACGADASCVNTHRRDVAAAFFIAEEFQQTGSFIYGFYKGAFGRRPAFSEYSTDRTQVVGGANLEAEKATFANNFVQRAEFVAKYQANTSADSFVDALIQNVRTLGVDLIGARAGLINVYNGGSTSIESRALVVRAVADDATFKQSQYSQAFVLTEYFNYLRRDPDQVGYDFWLNVLNNGDVGNYRGMVCSFITSTEYQRRFSGVVSHSNSECGQ